MAHLLTLLDLRPAIGRAKPLVVPGALSHPIALVYSLLLLSLHHRILSKPIVERARLATVRVRCLRICAAIVNVV